MTWVSKGKRAVEKESWEAALVMKVVSILSPCCRSPSKQLILFVLSNTKPYYFRAIVLCLVCFCCLFIDFSLNPVSCSDSFSLSLETQGQLIGHSPLPHSLPMIHPVTFPEILQKPVFPFSWDDCNIQEKWRQPLRLFFLRGGGEGITRGILGNVKVTSSKTDAECKTFIWKWVNLNKVYVKT